MTHNHPVTGSSPVEPNIFGEKMTEIEFKNKIINSFKERTGNKNMIGSIEKVVDELFPDIDKALSGDTSEGEDKFIKWVVDILNTGKRNSDGHTV